MILADGSVWVDHLRQDDADLRQHIELQHLMGRGLGYVDLHLLASTRVTAGARLWTRDRRLAEAARRLDIVW